jgi:predicted phage tail protein
MKRTITFHGVLAEKYGSEAKEVHADDTFMCIKGITYNNFELKQYIKDGLWNVVVYDKEGKSFNITNDMVQLNLGDYTEIHIAPAVEGDGGIWRAVIGVVLIVVGVLTFAIGGGFLIGIGASLLIGGVIELLTKPPSLAANTLDDANSGSDIDNQSHLYNGDPNIVGEGAAIPLPYGKVKVGSITILGSIESADIAVIS